MRRIERLINLIAALLETRRPLTADEIRTSIAGYNQHSYEAFRRSFERDKESLRNMGIPLELRPTDPFSEVADGYIIPAEKYYLPDLALEPDEAAALKLAAGSVLGGGEAAAGRLKLDLDAGPAPWSGPRLTFASDLVTIESAVGAFYEAARARHPVTFEYVRSGTDRPEKRSLDPYAVANSRGHWYVVGRDHDRDEVRSFRVDRVTSAVTPREGTYSVPEGFKASDYVGMEPWQIGDEPRAATVRFDASWRWWVEQNLPDAPRQEGPEGALDVEVTVANLERFVNWVIGFGQGVEILTPPQARHALLDRLQVYLRDEG